MTILNYKTANHRVNNEINCYYKYYKRIKNFKINSHQKYISIKNEIKKYTTHIV